jgi:uncharacterized protein YggT (Ycf19 family)
MKTHFEQRIASLAEWRFEMIAGIELYRSWLDANGIADIQQSLRIHDLIASLKQDRMTLALGGMELSSALGTVFFAACLLAAVKIVKMSIYILMVAVIMQAILSWVNPYSPVMPLLNSLTLPFLRPLQRRVPTIANVDLSPLVLIIALQLMLMVPMAWLEMRVARLF